MDIRKIAGGACREEKEAFIFSAGDAFETDAAGEYELNGNCAFTVKK